MSLHFCWTIKCNKHITYGLNSGLLHTEAIEQLLYIRPLPSDFKAMTGVFLRLPRWGRSCVHWSRMMVPGNRGWPSSWSRWWPWWLWRAEDRTSQGALGRDPIRNRAVPERRPVPMLFHHVTSSLRLSEMTSSLAFFLLPLTQIYFEFFIHTAAETSLSEKKKKKNLKGGSGLRLLSSTVQHGGFLIFTTGSASRGECLKGGHIGILRSPCRTERGEKHFMLPSRIYTHRWIVKNHYVGCSFCWELFFKIQ